MSKMRVTNTIKRTVNTGSQQTAATNANTEYVRVIADTDDDDGDKLATVRLHRLVGVIRSILEAPVYKTLGFEPPFISHTEVEEISIGEPERTDRENVMMGRVRFHVRTQEKSELQTAVPAKRLITKMLLYETEVGYLVIDPYPY